MLIPHWHSPIYNYRDDVGKEIIIDVTTSVSPGLPANHVFVDRVIPYLEKHDVYRVLDFGAGSLRHTIPLLKRGFVVGAVDYKRGFERPVCKKALEKLRDNKNFCALEWPNEYYGNREIFRKKFDAALLIYVLQTIPEPSERRDVLRFISRKLKINKYLFYCSRVNQLNDIDKQHRISDGYYKYPKREHHSFYREFATGETHEYMHKHKFERVRSFSERGTDQMYLYIKYGLFI